MPIDRRLIQTGVTHAAALLIGWGGWTMLRPASNAEGSGAAGVTKVRERRTDGERSADQILDIISPTVDGSSNAAQQWQDDEKNYHAQFEDLVRTVAAPDDLQSAVEAEMKLWDREKGDRSPKLAALLYFWSERDFSGLLKWADRNDEAKARAMDEHAEAVLGKIIEVKGSKAIFGLPKDDWSSMLASQTAGIVGRTGDPGNLAGAREAVNPMAWRNFMTEVAENWPWDAKAKFIEVAISENDPGLISKLAGSRNANVTEASAWLLEVMNDETLDAGFRQKLAKDGGLKSLATGDSRMPLETRVALMRGGNTEIQADQGLYDQLATNDVRSTLRGDEVDWNFQFRCGTMEASEVLAAFAAKFPEQAAKSPEAVRDRLFAELAEVDSARAVDLLKDMSPDARSKVVMNAAENLFFGVDPDRLLEMLQQVPPEDPATWDARLDAWVKHGPNNYQRLEDGYVDWVRALPEGVDRDMALYSLAQAAAGSNPSLTKELLGEVKNTKLREKMGGLK